MDQPVIICNPFHSIRFIPFQIRNAEKPRIPQRDIRGQMLQVYAKRWDQGIPVGLLPDRPEPPDSVQ